MPCIIVKDLTEQQMTELALLDNKTNEIAEWDFEMLDDILKDCDLDDFGELDWGVCDLEENEIADNEYEQKELKDNNTKFHTCPCCGCEFED